MQSHQEFSPYWTSIFNDWFAWAWGFSSLNSWNIWEICLYIYRCTCIGISVWTDRKNWKRFFLMANYKGGCAGLLEENLPWVKIKPGRTIRGLRAQRTMPSAIAWHLLLGLLQSRRIQLVLAFIGERNYNASEVMQSSNGKLINCTYREVKEPSLTLFTWG